MTRRLALAALPAASLLLLPAGAAAAPKTAKLASVQGAGQVVAYGADNVDGAPLTGRTLDRRHVYELKGVSAVVRYGNTTYRIAAGTNFALSDYRFSKGDRQTKPSIALLAGRVEVQTTAKAPGGVNSEEGLYNPLPAGPWKMRFTVQRRLTRASELTSIGRAMFFSNAGNQPRGTTTVKAAGKPAVNVTPYVGKNIGSCRHAHGARLTTKTGYGKGTATYAGLVA
jgi:hypothetical protein